MKLGVIADDFTGATDIAGFLVNNGLSTIQLFGVPRSHEPPEANAYVVSLKSRSIPGADAVRVSLDSLEWLKRAGCTQFYFKYCSTFDSTEKGNIGPVADALLARLGEAFTVVCPSLPVNGRTVYQGYLFVHDQLLSESGMRNHPVTPMRDSKLQRVLAPQTDGSVTEIHVDVIDRGREAVAARIDEARAGGYRYAILDTVADRQLSTIAQAIAGMPLVTGASGLGGALAAVHAVRGGVDARAAAGAVGAASPSPGRAVILSGSCSVATNRQVERYTGIGASFFVDPKRCMDGEAYVDELVEWASSHLDDEWAPLLYATSPPNELARTQSQFGAAAVGKAIETTLGTAARRLVDAGVRNVIVAGGETSGRVVQSLGLVSIQIGPQIAPGVPWTKAVDRDIFLALKSGNFGSEDFFIAAQEFFHG